jgi:hypothetical protein
MRFAYAVIFVYFKTTSLIYQDCNFTIKVIILGTVLISDAMMQVVCCV